MFYLVKGILPLEEILSYEDLLLVEVGSVLVALK
jgi:hypothetical protein